MIIVVRTLLDHVKCYLFNTYRVVGVAGMDSGVTSARVLIKALASGAVDVPCITMHAIKLTPWATSGLSPLSPKPEDAK